MTTEYNKPCTTTATGTEIPVVHEPETKSNGLLLGAAVLALGALAVAGGAALMGDDNYDRVAAYDDDAVVTAEAVSGDYDADDAYADAEYVDLDENETVYTADLDDADMDDVADMMDDSAVIGDNDIEAALNDETDYAEATVYAAQDDEADTTIEYETDHDAEPKTAVMGAVEMHPAKINDTVGEILQADGQPSIQSDEDIIVMDDTVNEDVFRAADDDGMVADNAIVVPGSNGTLTTVTCPAGTTAQTDMTCEITGDYVADLND
ncbi:MAG: hypothetical protein AAF311_12055 [Pseudomonadota bacterium]